MLFCAIAILFHCMHGIASISVVLCICRLVNVLCELIYLDATTCYEHILFTKQTSDGAYTHIKLFRCCMDKNTVLWLCVQYETNDGWNKSKTCACFYSLLTIRSSHSSLGSDILVAQLY